VASASKPARQSGGCTGPGFRRNCATRWMRKAAPQIPIPSAAWTPHTFSRSTQRLTGLCGRQDSGLQAVPRACGARQRHSAQWNTLCPIGIVRRRQRRAVCCGNRLRRAMRSIFLPNPVRPRCCGAGLAARMAGDLPDWHRADSSRSGAAACASVHWLHQRRRPPVRSPSRFAARDNSRCGSGARAHCTRSRAALNEASRSIHQRYEYLPGAERMRALAQVTGYELDSLAAALNYSGSAALGAFALPPSSCSRRRAAGFCSRTQGPDMEIEASTLNRAAELLERLKTAIGPGRGRTGGRHRAGGGMPRRLRTRAHRRCARARKNPVGAKHLHRRCRWRHGRVQFTPDMMLQTSSDMRCSIQHPTSCGSLRVPCSLTFCSRMKSTARRPRPKAPCWKFMQEYAGYARRTEHHVAQASWCLPTQNPVETEGTYPLPEAQLDRFLFKVEIGYPTLAEEVGVVVRATANTGRQRVAALGSQTGSQRAGRAQPAADLWRTRRLTSR